MANTFGVSYHERHHSFDAIIKTETGVDIQPILDVANYDKEITHGNNPQWEYIRHKENTQSLVIMKPYLLRALKIRKDRHTEVIRGLMMTVVKLASELLYLLRMKKKDGVLR